MSEKPARNPARLVLVLGLLAAFGPLSIDMYLPALPAIAGDLGGGMEGAQLTLAAFFLGMAAGQLVHGPLADRYGRRRPLFAALGLYIAASVMCAAAQEMGWLVALRFLQAVGGCAGMVISRAVVRDLADRLDPVRLMARLMLVMGTAPILAPLLGGLVASVAGWRAIFVLLALVGVLALVASALVLPETLPPERRRRVSAREVLGSFGALLANGRFMATGAASGCAIAGMFAYIAGSPHVFITIHEVAPAHYGLFFGAAAAGIVGFGQLSGPLAQRFGRARVYGAALAGLAGAGLWVALAAALGLGFWPLYGGLLAYMAMLGMVMPLGVVLAITPFPHMAGTASALLGTLQFGFGALAGVALSALHDGSALPMAALIALAGLGGLVIWRVLGAGLRAEA